MARGVRRTTGVAALGVGVALSDREFGIRCLCPLAVAASAAPRRPVASIRRPESPLRPAPDARCLLGHFRGRPYLCSRARSRELRRPMRITVVHQYYLAPGEPGISRFNEMARFWSAAGHEVTVIAGTVSLSTGRTHPGTEGRILVRTSDGPIAVWRAH